MSKLTVHDAVEASVKARWIELLPILQPDLAAQNIDMANEPGISEGYSTQHVLAARVGGCREADVRTQYRS
jgi:hypothetical protein